MRKRYRLRLTGFILASTAVILFGGVRLSAQTYQVEYRFQGFYGHDAGCPQSRLLSIGNVLYGTTYCGGAGTVNDGTVFQFDLGTKTETVLYSFAGPPADGSGPTAGLIRDSAGNFYGITYYGGPMNAGTVFEIDTGGHETVLHSFGGSEGSHPYGGVVIDSAGNLYGTLTDDGLFRLDPSGTVTVLHQFPTYSGDGYDPQGDLLLEGENIYGTMIYGGSGGGTVFRYNISTGSYTLLYAFPQGNPWGGVISDGHGRLFGTTTGGGVQGEGSIFELDLSTKLLTTLFSFNGSNGSFPLGELVRDSQGDLFGVCRNGGGGNPNNFGTVYELDSAGTLTNFHSFTNSNGQLPYAGLTRDSRGLLYGTAFGGTPSGLLFQVNPK